MRPKQKKLANRVLDLTRVIDVTWCRGSGKSFVLGLLGYFLARRLGWTIIITAPTIAQTWAIMEWVHWAKAKMLATRKKRISAAYDNRYELILRNGGKVVCLSGKEYTNVQGKHGHVVIVDEKQDMLATVVSESFLPMLGNTNGILILAGVGGDPTSAGEIIGKTAEYRTRYPWQKHIKFDPTYKNIVMKAKKIMLPEEFMAHYECKPLDISNKMLVPRLIPYKEPLDREPESITIGIDWGKRVDLSVITVRKLISGASYLSDWFIARGPYDEQIIDIIEFLQLHEYDAVFPETNGVGDAAVDLLLASIKETSLSGIYPILVNQDWKNRFARKIHSESSNGRLYYNEEHEHADMFLKEIQGVTYTCNINRNITLDHSDFLSSLFLTFEESASVYI